MEYEQYYNKTSFIKYSHNSWPSNMRLLVQPVLYTK